MPWAAAGVAAGEAAAATAFSPHSHSRAAVQPGTRAGAVTGLGIAPWADKPDGHVLFDGYKHVEGGVSLLVGMERALPHGGRATE